MPELIKGDAAPFIILTFAAAMMAVIAAILNYVDRLGISKLLLISWPVEISLFNFGLIAFICFLINQFLGLLNIALQTHFFDAVIICLFMLEKAFVISWIVWVIAAKKEYS